MIARKLTWKSILKARDVLRKGMRKVIGNDRSTRIWHEPWLPNAPGFCAQRVHQEASDEPQYVGDFIEAKGWQKIKLIEWFPSVDVIAILKIPLPRYDVDDEWTWIHSKNGLFTVRSAYNMLVMEEKRSRASHFFSQKPFSWKKLWKAGVYPKIRMFAWRVMHKGLAMRVELQNRGMSLDTTCPMRGEVQETLNHVVMTCPEVRRVWYFSLLRLQVDKWKEISAFEWCVALQQSFKDEV